MSSSTQKGGCGCGSSSMTTSVPGRAMAKKSGCGCGGGGGCGCSGAISPGADSSSETCSPCSQAAFERPVFFAGQLLTEDDLGALASYVTAKNRLHNSRMFGAGVVCGLEVICHPCGNGKVIVCPGYALDCCGDDLVLGCERELDIVAMIRALRAKLKGGWDCGHPCAEGGAPDGTNAVATSKDTNTPSASTDASAKPTTSEYCLYLRYTETPTDLVAPYPTDDSCGGACEATRVLEGVTFELRCPSTKPVDDLWTRLTCCMETLKGTDAQTADGVVLQRRANEIDLALDHVDDKQVSYTADDVASWKASLASMKKVAPPTSEADVLALVEYVRSIGASAVRAARMSVSNNAAYTQLLADMGDAYGKAVKTSLPRASGYLVPEQQEEVRLQGAPTNVIEQYVTSPLQRAIAYGVVSSYRTYIDADDAARETFPARLFSYGGVYEHYTAPAYTAALQGLRNVAVDRASNGSMVDCRLSKDAASLTVASPSNADAPTLQDARTFQQTTDRTIGIVLRALANCVCAALNPPCVSCDDPAVLLACLKVEGCEVVEICNLARTFVLTSSAMRYWVPPLTWLGKLLETACCGRAELTASPRRAATRIASDPRASFMAQTIARPSLGALAGIEPAFYGQTLDSSLPRVASTLVALASQRIDFVSARLPPALRREVSG